MSDAHRELTAELALADAGALARLTDDDAARLAEAIRAARAAQQATIATAIDAAMSHVPRVLRGALKRILF